MVFIQDCQLIEITKAYFENCINNRNSGGIEAERVLINLWNKSVQIHIPVTIFCAKNGFDETMHYVNVIEKRISLLCKRKACDFYHTNMSRQSQIPKSNQFVYSGQTPKSIVFWLHVQCYSFSFRAFLLIQLGPVFSIFLCLVSTVQQLSTKTLIRERCSMSQL